MNVTRHLWLALLALLVSTAGVGCGNDKPTYEAERAIWESTGPLNYEIEYTVSGSIGLLGPTKITVLDGEIVRPNEAHPAYEFGVTGLFEAIDEADKVNGAEFDPDYGYPKKLQLDPLSGAIDDEYTVVVLAFTALSE